MKKRFVCLSLSVAIACVAAGPLSADDGPAPMKVSKAFRSTVYLDHVKYLASEELGGRGTGTPGLRKAAEYIADLFEKAGCEPAGDDGTFFQNFDIPSGKKIDAENSSLTVDGLGGIWMLNETWRPLPFSATDEVEGPLAFLGYGIEADDFDYNDYADFDVEGKVLLVLRYEPRDEDDDAEFGGKDRSRHSLFVTKARRAVDNGAVAILVVDQRNKKDELYRFNSRQALRSYGLPMASITRKVADRLLEKAGLPSCKAIEKKIESTRTPMSTDMEGLTVRLSAALAPSKLETRNVVGLLKGDGSTDEVIIVGAHYDHLGTRTRNGEKIVSNGADDNASGTAAIIELARAFAAGPKMRRNILFMTFSAEERGLIGSRYFANNPTIDLSRAKAMFNMDMIGRLSQDKFEVWGTDTAVEFADLVKRAAEAVEVSYTAPDRSGGIFSRSDHANFFRKGIPILFPFTGLHEQYHRPTDDWELIDSEGAVKVLQMAHLIIGELAQMKEGPTFLKDAPKKEPTESETRAAERRARRNESEGDNTRRPSMPPVSLGIMPSYSDEGESGLLVDGLVDDGPSEKAGIKENDRIVKIGKSDVTDIYSLMTALADYKPGDKVKVVVQRGDKKVTVEVELGKPARRGGQGDGG